MDKHPVSDLMESVMSKVREMVNVSNVVGEPLTLPDGIVMIPISKVSFGFGSGGSDFAGKKDSNANKNGFGGGGGAGVKIEPMAFVVIKDGAVRIMNVEAPASNSIERAIDAAPELIDKLVGLKKKMEDDKPAPVEAVDTEDTGI